MYPFFFEVSVFWSMKFPKKDNYVVLVQIFLEISAFEWWWTASKCVYNEWVFWKWHLVFKLIKMYIVIFFSPILLLTKISKCMRNAYYQSSIWKNTRICLQDIRCTWFLVHMMKNKCKPIVTGLEPAIPRSEVWCLIH